MSPRLWKHRVQDILDAIAKIKSYVKDMDLDAFCADPKTVDAVIRNLIVIGEAARGVPPAVQDADPQVPWRLMADLRNFAVHEYWGVELPTIWETVQKDLPSLAADLTSVLSAEEPD